MNCEEKYEKALKEIVNLGNLAYSKGTSFSHSFCLGQAVGVAHKALGADFNPAAMNELTELSQRMGLYEDDTTWEKWKKVVEVAKEIRDKVKQSYIVGPQMLSKLCDAVDTLEEEGPHKNTKERENER